MVARGIAPQAVVWAGESLRLEAQRSADRHVQAEREELRDAAEDHDDGNHQVDDAAATRGDMLAWGRLDSAAKGEAAWLFPPGGELEGAESSQL